MADHVHPTLRRLLRYVTQATAGQPGAISDFGPLAQRLDVSSARMTNWKTRGLSKEGALAAEAAFGCSAHWLLTGEGPSVANGVAERAPHWTIPQHADAGSRTRGLPVAHTVSQPPESDAPLIDWERLMTTELPVRYRVQLRDDALAPNLHAGDELVFDRTLEPLAGDIVLVRDQAGNHYARTYRERLAGEWVAHATNPAFEPLDARAESLAVVGVCIVELRKRRRTER